jgi:hypothetical protein
MEQGTEGSPFKKLLDTSEAVTGQQVFQLLECFMVVKKFEA